MSDLIFYDFLKWTKSWGWGDPFRVSAWTKHWLRHNLLIGPASSFPANWLYFQQRFVESSTELGLSCLPGTARWCTSKVVLWPWRVHAIVATPHTALPMSSSGLQWGTYLQRTIARHHQTQAPTTSATHARTQAMDLQTLHSAGMELWLAAIFVVEDRWINDVLPRMQQIFSNSQM